MKMSHAKPVGATSSGGSVVTAVMKADRDGTHVVGVELTGRRRSNMS